MNGGWMVDDGGMVDGIGKTLAAIFCSFCMDWSGLLPPGQHGIPVSVNGFTNLFDDIVKPVWLNIMRAKDSMIKLSYISSFY